MRSSSVATRAADNRLMAMDCLHGGPGRPLHVADLRMLEVPEPGDICQVGLQTGSGTSLKKCVEKEVCYSQ